MKTLCLATENLNELMTDLYNTPAEVVFSEEKEIEVIQFPGQDVEEIALEDSLEKISNQFNTTVESFDVMDLGELGFGFVFFLQ